MIPGFISSDYFFLLSDLALYSAGCHASDHKLAQEHIDHKRWYDRDGHCRKQRTPVHLTMRAVEHDQCSLQRPLLRKGDKCLGIDQVMAN